MYEPRTEDVGSIDGIIHASYECISGPAGQTRDWDRFRSLFLPDGRLILAISRSGEAPWARFLTVEDYIRRVEPFFAKEDFWEYETERKAEIIGNYANVLSTYASSREPGGKAFEGGVNSIQLFTDGSRWWFATIMWNTARP